MRNLKEPQYVPASLARIALSGELVVLGDLLAENDHEVWAKEYFQNGWTVRYFSHFFCEYILEFRLLTLVFV